VATHFSRLLRHAWDTVGLFTYINFLTLPRPDRLLGPLSSFPGGKAAGA
jgi:hypothetical protein